MFFISNEEFSNYWNKTLLYTPMWKKTTHGNNLEAAFVYGLALEE